MSRLIVWCRDNPWTVLCVLALVTAFFGYHARSVRVTSSTEEITLADDPFRPAYDRAVETFGSDNLTCVYVKDRDLFTPEKLAAVEEVFYNLKDIPGVLRVDGLFNATNFKGEDGTLTTGPFLDPIPEDPAEIARVKADALRSPLLKRTLISPDGTGLALTVTALPDSDEPDFNRRVADDIDRAIAPLKGRVEQVFQVGEPATKRLVAERTMADERQSGILCFAVLMTALILGIRTVNGAVLPTLTAGLSILWTVGFMGLSGIPITILTGIVPSLLLIIGATEDMYMLCEYQHGLAQGRERMGAIQHMADQMGLAVLLTGVTTVIGFLSVSVNEIVGLKQFGVVASFALFVNPLITFALIPVYLRFFGERAAPASFSDPEAQGPFVHRLADGVLHLVNRHPRAIVTGALAAALLACVGVSRLRVDNDVMGFFKADSEVRARSEQLHRELSGVQLFYIVLDAGREGAFKQAGNLKAVEAIQRRIEQTPAFDLSLSLASHIALLNREMSGGDPQKFAVPDRDDLISQYLLFLKRSDIERYVSPDFSQASILVRHNISSSHELKKALDELLPFARQAAGKGLRSWVTGKGILYSNAADTMARGQAYSLLTSGIPIFLIMTFLFVRLKAGLLAMVPNLIPVLFLFGIMGALGIPLNPPTAMIAAGALGIAVDDTIHIFTRYNQEMRRHNDQQKALAGTIHGDLRPVLTASVALAAGFSTLGFASLKPSIHYGLLSAAVILISLATELLITPLLLSRTRLITLWDLLGLHLTENVIKRSELFRDMTPFQVKKIVLLGHVRDAAAGDHIVRQGERERTMYMILEGAARVELETETGDRVVLRELSEGEVFGEIALVDEVARTAHVIAVGPAKVLSVDWTSLERIRRVFPRISTRLFLNIARILGTRLAFTNAQLAEANRRVSKA